MKRIKKIPEFVETNMVPLTLILILICLTVLFVQVDAVMNPTKDSFGGEWSLLPLIVMTLPLFEGVDRDGR